jgi:hypothetical protein
MTKQNNGLTAHPTNERVKLYIVIALACFAAIFAYFRFFYERSETGTVTAGPPPEAMNFDVQKIKRIKPHKTETHLSVEIPFRRDIRNIFVSTQLSEALKQSIQPDAHALSEKDEEPPASHTVTIELKGTIIDGKNPMAIINDQFVRIGETIGDYQVMRIAPDEVYLKSGEQDKLLRVVRSAKQP